MFLNVPLLVGGAINWFVSSRSKNKDVNDARSERGTLIASGFIAGGALMGVVSAGLRFFGVEFECSFGDDLKNVLAVVAYAAICIYLIMACLKAKKD